MRYAKNQRANPMLLVSPLRRKRNERRMLLLTYALAVLTVGILSLLAGCSAITYDSPDGAHFSRMALGTDSHLQGLKFSTGADGTRHLEIEGVNSNQTDALKAVAEGAAMGAVKGATP